MKKNPAQTAFTRNRLVNSALCLIMLLNATATSAKNTTYYVDNVKGNNNNTGTSSGKAWKTLDKLNAIRFEPGDVILLKRGQIYNGSLYLKGSGLNGAPIKLGAFGTGARPVINTASNGYAVKLLDVAYWEIAGIETKGGDKAGIFIGCTKDGLVLNSFRITNCYVHDVGQGGQFNDWDLHSKSTGGIVIINGYFDKEEKFVSVNSIFNKVVIDGCTVRYIKRWNCITITSGKINNVKGDASLIRNCTVEYSIADGLRMNGVKNSLIEYCTMYKNGAWPNDPGYNLGGLGAWFWDADSCTIQFCEASYINNPRGDGGAFDIDYWQTNSTVQYCYGHDCHGYGVSVYAAAFPTVNSVARYNIFANNGRDTGYAYQGDYFLYTWNEGTLNGVKIYNNTSYWNPEVAAAALKQDAHFSGNNENIFKNNIIYSDHPWLVSLRSDTLKLDNNIYWVANGEQPLWSMRSEKYHSLSNWQGATGQDLHSKYADPMLHAPAYHGKKIPTTQFSPKPGSPAINAGVDAGGMGKRDFTGNQIPGRDGKYTIGAVKFNGSYQPKNHKNKIGALSQVGAPAPDFELYTIKKEKIKPGDYKGSLVLLSFINTQNATEAIRSQLVFIKSMKRQYSDKGLKIVLIDESYRSANVPEDAAINFMSDNEISDIPLVRDNNSKKIAEKYGITILPTTFLISKEGTINQRWENTALSAQLALAIEAKTGKKQKPDAWETPAQTIFPGFAAARPLSEKIWMVDGGKSWKKGKAQTVRLLVFSGKKINISLTAVNQDHHRPGKSIQLIPEAIAGDEAKILLANIAGATSKIYSAVLPVSLDEKGHYTLRAMVIGYGSNEVLFSGNAQVTVD
jgi:peroxiredoxin